MENCRYNHEAMQYALIKGSEGMPDLIVDANEFHCLSMYFENRVEFEEVELNDNKGDYIIAYGNIYMMPGHDETKFVEQVKELKNVCYLSVQDENIQQFELIDNMIIEMEKTRKEIPIVALIRTPFEFSSYGQQCTTTYLKYGDMTALESLLNRQGFLAFSHYKKIEPQDVEFWTTHIDKEDINKSHEYDWLGEDLDNIED